jgi:hypothetical protein
LDQQHDDVVLMVENFCSRASPTCSREREMWRAAVGPAARVRRGARPSPPLPFKYVKGVGQGGNLSLQVNPVAPGRKLAP